MLTFSSPRRRKRHKPCQSLASAKSNSTHTYSCWLRGQPAYAVHILKATAMQGSLSCAPGMRGFRRCTAWAPSATEWTMTFLEGPR
jgi:hypothetical protein